MHLVLCSPPNHRRACWRFDGDARQFRRSQYQSVQREIDTGRYDAAFVGAAIVNDIIGGRCAEVDDDQVAGVEMVCRDGIDNPVCAYCAGFFNIKRNAPGRSEAHTSELQSLMRLSYAVFCLNKKNTHKP